MPRKDDGKLGGLVRRKVVREIALREPGTTLSSIAKKYGVTPASITEFKQRHAEEIAAVAADAENEFAGMLIAQKQFRLDALEDLYNRALTPVPKVTNSGRVAYTDDGEPVMEVYLGEARQALRAAADELGQIPQRVQITGSMDTTTTYKIVNVSDDDLT